MPQNYNSSMESQHAIIFIYCILLSFMSEQTPIQNILRTKFAPRTPNSLILATILSGFTFYFTRQQINHFQQHQAALIARAEQEQTADNFKNKFDYQKVQDWNCRKVNLDGVLKEGRFMVKRNRGKQEGYIVLAPFIVSSYNSETTIKDTYANHSASRKFILNLGWIPKSRKHLIFATIPQNMLGQEVYEDRLEAIEKQREDGLIRDPLSPEISMPITNITAYIRTGEQEDQNNGRINWKQNFLYKWINLRELSRVFRVFNEEQGEAVYLERVARSADEPESFPLSATKQTLIADLKTQSKHFENNANKAFGLTALASFGIALWSTFL